MAAPFANVMSRFFHQIEEYQDFLEYYAPSEYEVTQLAPRRAAHYLNRLMPEGSPAINFKSAQDDLRQKVCKDRIEDYTASIGYVPDALRNSKVQPIAVKITDASSKYKIIAIPGNPLAAGDILEFYNEHWIVINICSADVMNLIGIAMQCNHLFQRQSWSPKIIKRWDVLDRGVYAGDGDQTPVVYETNSVSESCRKGDSLLMLNAKTTNDYNKRKDNLALTIADYIAPDNEPAPLPPANPALPSCSISGWETLKALLGTQKYTAALYGKDGEAEDTSIAAVWEVVTPLGHERYVQYTVNSNTLSLSTDDGAVGKTAIILRTLDENGLYQPCEFTVKVNA